MDILASLIGTALIFLGLVQLYGVATGGLVVESKVEAFVHGGICAAQVIGGMLCLGVL